MPLSEGDPEGIKILGREDMSIGMRVKSPDGRFKGKITGVEDEFFAVHLDNTQKPMEYDYGDFELVAE